MFLSFVEVATRPVNLFSLDETTTIATRWEKYKKRFVKLLIDRCGTKVSQKLALLLNDIGEEYYDIYDNLLIPGTQESYNNARRLFDGHFNGCVPYISVSLFFKCKRKHFSN